jgi:hypothetical protein
MHFAAGVPFTRAGKIHEILAMNPVFFAIFWLFGGNS